MGYTRCAPLRPRRRRRARTDPVSGRRRARRGPPVGSRPAPSDHRRLVPRRSGWPAAPRPGHSKHGSSEEPPRSGPGGHAVGRSGGRVGRLRPRARRDARGMGRSGADHRARRALPPGALVRTAARRPACARRFEGRPSIRSEQRSAPHRPIRSPRADAAGGDGALRRGPPLALPTVRRPGVWGARWPDRGPVDAKRQGMRRASSRRPGSPRRRSTVGSRAQMARAVGTG